jgi:hypothetical protein
MCGPFCENELTTGFYTPLPASGSLALTCPCLSRSIRGISSTSRSGMRRLDNRSPRYFLLRPAIAGGYGELVASREMAVNADTFDCYLSGEARGKARDCCRRTINMVQRVRDAFISSLAPARWLRTKVMALFTEVSEGLWCVVAHKLRTVMAEVTSVRPLPFGVCTS